jgi:hypothetical protein
MDTLCHAVYGATICSRRGLAGGLRGAESHPTWHRDPHVWLGAAFGLLPDLASLGLPYLLAIGHGNGSFFHGVSASTLETYHWMHSLLTAGAVLALIAWLRPRWLLPALAWPLHILMDAFTHAQGGRFATRLFHPLSDVGLPGVNWWEHPRVWAGIWLVLPVVWLGLWLARRQAKRDSTQCPPSVTGTGRSPS